MSQKSSSSEWIGQPIGGSPLQAVLLAGKLCRSTTGYKFVASSLPGHLIQLTVRGRTVHEVSGRHYDLRRGSLIWYHEDEPVRGVVTDGPWEFYTVNFVAPSLAPPPFEQRVQRVGPAVAKRFAQLLSAWNGTAAPPAVRTMQVHAALLQILSRLQSPRDQPFGMDPSASLWWNLETRLRQDLSQPIDLNLMGDLTGRSTATLARSCQSAVGVTPMKRIKQIRLSLARGLVRRSPLSFSQIAARIGYDRVHEFSRDYRKHFGTTATADRAESNT